MPDDWPTVEHVVRLRSLVPGALFTVTVTAAWHSDEGIPTQTATAVVLHWLCEQISKVTKQYSVLEAESAALAVNAAVGWCRRVKQASGEEHATLKVIGKATFTCTSHDHEVTDDYLAMQRDELGRIGRSEMRLRALKKLFGEPGMAQLWWADRNPQLLAALRDQTFDVVIAKIPERRPDEPGTFARVLEDFFNSLTDRDKSFALAVFETVLEKTQAPTELQERLRQVPGSVVKPRTGNLTEGQAEQKPT